MEAIAAQKKEKDATNKGRRIFKSAVLIGLAVFLVVAFFGIGAIKSIIDGAPPLDLNKINDQSQTSFFYDQDGNPVTEYFGLENRVWATLDEIPVKLQKAFIAVEDKRFYDHKGIDVIRLGGAFINNIKGGHVQGASTITQQLIKTLYLTPERKYERKIQEAWLAFKLEDEFSKEEILEAYLNTVNFGEGNYGVKAASTDYFGKEDMNELTIKEMAVLAGLVRNPSSYNPRRNYHIEKDRKHITEDRAEVVLKAMLENEYITEEEYQKAVDEELYVVRDAARLKLYDAAPFIENAIYEVRDAIIKLKGWEEDKESLQRADQFIYSNGLKIYTTLDMDIQKAVEETLYTWDGYPEMPGDETDLPQPQAAAVVMDNSGHIKAIVGGRTPPAGKRELNRARMPLMMGSTMKPIAVYGPALEGGKSPATVYHNIPVKIEGWNPQQDFPNNYGGGGYTGPTTMRHGLRKSLNVVAAQALTYDVGFENSKTYLEGLGIDPDHIQVNGSGLALGTSAIKPVEMAGAYSAIANGGVFNEPISVLKVVDRDGKTIIDRTQTRVTRKVFSESTSWLLIDMMKDAVKNGTGDKALIPGMTVAGKTGTNTEFKGVAFAGFTPYYTGVVWIGHDEGKSLGDNVQGGKYAAPLWQAFMARIHEEAGLPDKDILDKDPEELGLVKRRICRISGKLAGPDCPADEIVTDWFSAKSVPQEVCDQHGVIRICSETGELAGPYCPEEGIVSKSVYFLEAGSPYWQLSKDRIRKYIPGVNFNYSSMWDINGLDYDNPEHQGYFCHLHTQPPEPNPEDFWDDLKDFFEGLIPGQKDEVDPGNNGDHNGDNGEDPGAGRDENGGDDVSENGNSGEGDINDLNGD
ncbi:MAG: PBP1A family penicillin-binding protein [Clostridiales bacterium]|nr:PBP1A family penicillin-binding protein [Clostridiales bacterium]